MLKKTEEITNIIATISSLYVINLFAYDFIALIKLILRAKNSKKLCLVLCLINTEPSFLSYTSSVTLPQHFYCYQTPIFSGNN